MPQCEAHWGGKSVTLTATTASDFKTKVRQQWPDLPSTWALIPQSHRAVGCWPGTENRIAQTFENYVALQQDKTNEGYYNFLGDGVTLEHGEIYWCVTTDATPS